MSDANRTAGGFSTDELGEKMRVLLSSGYYNTPAGLRASVASSKAEGGSRAEFHHAFSEAMSELEAEGVLKRQGDGHFTVADPPPSTTEIAGREPEADGHWTRKPVSRGAVLLAIEEFDHNGRDETLSRHGFRRALDYVVDYKRSEYDSKALYGIAYGIQYPDEPPIRDRGLSGGTGVTRKLEGLGFKIKRLREQADAALARPDAKAWIIRAGRGGENEDLARDESIALIGWSELGEIGPETSREELKDLIRDTGESRAASVNAQASSIYRFIHELQEGDMVVLPLQTEPGKASVGIVDGPFRYRPDGVFKGRDAHYQRPVAWLSWGLPYDSFDTDMQSAFRAQGTVSEIRRDNSVSRLLAATKDGGEPSRSAQPAEGDHPPPASPEPVPEEDEAPSSHDYAEPSLASIEAAVEAGGLRIAPRTLRRYHVALKTRGFVILAGVSGGGKTWLAETYADAVGAALLVVPVAPNWTTNEDLLGYLNPIDGAYCHTAFSRFLMRAAREHAAGQAAGRGVRPFHLVLDEMNLARVEHYFAKFLSAMETAARDGTSRIALSPELEVELTPNLKVVGTVNVDETTFGFADKVYDRAQLIELEVPRQVLGDHVAGKPHGDAILAIWDAVFPVAPFAFRVLDEVDVYVRESTALGATWQEAVDDQLLQKVLPKIKGTDPKIRTALEQLVALTATDFPLSHGKATGMLEDFTVHGFVSYF